MTLIKRKQEAKNVRSMYLTRKNFRAKIWDLYGWMQFKKEIMTDWWLINSKPRSILIKECLWLTLRSRRTRRRSWRRNCVLEERLLAGRDVFAVGSQERSKTSSADKRGVSMDGWMVSWEWWYGWLDGFLGVMTGPGQLSLLNKKS